MPVSNYNLDEEVGEDYFNFTIEGIEYKMRYPNTLEINEKSKLKTHEELAEWSFSLITPVKEGDPQIFDTLEKVPLNKLRAFNEMVAKEYGAK